MRYILCACACAGLAGRAASGAVEMRIVERTGQSVATSSDAVLDFAIQARVTGARLRAYAFNMRIAGEAEGRGVLARSLISEVDGTYAAAIATNSSVGRGGVARQYSYLAAINSSFNGLINTSGATFTNGPDQEIGLITGLPAGSALLATPGLDADGDGNPDTWSGNGTGATPANGTIVPLDPALAGPYFAQGQFIDIYRFRYTVTDMTVRSLQFTLEIADFNVFQSLIYNNETWGPSSASNTTLTIPVPLAIQVVPAPATTAVVGGSMVVGVIRRRRGR